MRDLQLRIAEQEEDLKRNQRELRIMQFETLPTMMDIAGVDHLGLPATSNLPAADLVLTPYYHANISAKWSPERQQAALQAMEAVGQGDLIKTQMHITLGRGEHKLVAKITNLLAEQYTVFAETKDTIHNQTLTAWLRDAVQNGEPLPPLEVIGASVGRIATLKERG